MECTHAHVHAHSTTPIHSWQRNKCSETGCSSREPSVYIFFVWECINSIIFVSETSWDEEFNIQELALSSSTRVVNEEIQSHAKIPGEGDELAKTAAMLLENVQHEQNPKFIKSEFMTLMRQLRDGQMVVEGNQIVENLSGTQVNGGNVDVKGKGKQNFPLTSLPSSVSQMQQRSPGFGDGIPVNIVSDIQETQMKIQEDENDTYFRQDNQEYANYWQTLNTASATQMAHANPVTTDWDKLQADWEHFEATATGIKAVDSYQFQDGNPYLLGDSSTTRHHAAHSAGPYSVVEVRLTTCLRAIARFGFPPC